MGMSGPRQVGPRGMTAFVPNGDSRKDTAIILLGTAQEYGLDDSREVAATQGGFYISDRLADLLYDESEQVEPEPEPVKTKARKNASGNRAAKNSTTEKE